MENIPSIPHFDFLYSDPHYYHGRIVGYTNRPFQQEHPKDSRAMNIALTDRYNAVVGQSDTVLWLGDTFFHVSREWMRKHLERLNGHKILILGNHDKSRTKMLDVGFEWAAKEAFVELCGKRIHLHHYPYIGRGGISGPKNPKHQGEDFLIHGHTHSTVRIQGNMINICVEAWDYRPVYIEEVLEIIRSF